MTKMIKNSQIGPYFLAITAVVIFALVSFATPTKANFFDDVLDCFPLPICPPSGLPGLPIPGGYDSHYDYCDYDCGYDYDYDYQPHYYPTHTPAPSYTPPPAPQPVTINITNNNTNTNTNTVNADSGSGTSRNVSPYYLNPTVVYQPYPTYVPTYHNYPNQNYNYYAPQPVYVPPAPIYPRDLDIGCYSDPTKVKLNQPTTWIAEVTGGIAPYRYTWSGSEGLWGNQNMVTKFYGTTGTKSAVVTVISADGRTGTRACSNTVTVSSNVVAKKPVAKPAPVVTPTPKAPVCPTDCASVNIPQYNQQQSAGAFFSLENVPWGWVSFIIILVLFVTVVYLIVNRPKI